MSIDRHARARPTGGFAAAAPCATFHAARKAPKVGGWVHKAGSVSSGCTLRRIEAHVDEGVDLLASADIADAEPLGAYPDAGRVRGVRAACVG